MMIILMKKKTKTNNNTIIVKIIKRRKKDKHYIVWIYEIMNISSFLSDSIYIFHKNNKTYHN